MSQGNVRIYQLALRTFTPEGTLRAAAKMLPHVSDCGFTHVQLTPITESDGDPDMTHWSKRQLASNMGNPNSNYRLKDYYRIDAEYGNEEDLRYFVRSAHKQGLKVLLDLVYYHCGPNSTLVKEYPSYMQRNPDGSLHIGDWRTPLPDYTNPDLCEYMWENMLYFVREFDVDGYRCDVGDRVPVAFWTEGIKRCKELKPDFFMLNEGRGPEWLECFDCNYFVDCTFDSVKIPAGEMTAEEYRLSWQKSREELPAGGRILHFVDNHDVCNDSYENRHEKVLGHEAMEVLHVMDFTLDGIPFMFNGNELADELKHSLFSNRFHGRDDTLQWENLSTEDGIRRMEVTSALNSLRDEYPCLNTENLEWVDHTCPDSVLAYTRTDGSEKLLVVLNLRDQPVSVHLNLGDELMEPVMDRYCKYKTADAGTDIQMLGYGYLIAEL